MTLQEAKNLILQHPGKFYTYLLRRPNGIPFYVGKGNSKGFRIEQHCKSALLGKGSNKHKNNTIIKILEEGDQIDYDIAWFTSSEEEAFDKEMELINFYGRKSQGGILVNMTDGGEGTSGWIISNKTRSKMVANGKKRIGPLNSRYGVVLSADQIEKMRASNKGKHHNLSPKGRKNLSDIRKGVPPANKGIKMTKEQMANMMAANKLPKVKERRTQAQKIAQNRSDVKEKKSKKMKEIWQKKRGDTIT